MNKVVLEREFQSFKTNVGDQISVLQQQINDITAGGGSGGGGLKYKEITLTTSLAVEEIKSLEYVLESNTLLITNIYFKSSGGNCKFKIFNKSTDGFIVYSVEGISIYEDSLFLTYNDNEGQNKLRMSIENQSRFPTDMTITILGLTVIDK